MKRRLAIILVLAMLVTALSGIAIFSSAAPTATKDPIRMLLWGVNKYQYNLTVDNTNDAYNYLQGIKQEIPAINMTAPGALSIISESGVQYSNSTANIAKLVAVMINGDYKNAGLSNRNIPGTANQPAGSRYIGFNVGTVLSNNATNTTALAKVTSGIKNFLTEYKAAGGQLDGVMTDKADATLLNQYVFSAVEEVFPGIVMVAYDVAALNSWQQTGTGANSPVAGNSSSVLWENNITGFTLTDYDKFIGTILRLQDVKAATNGNIQFVVNRNDMRAPYYYNDAIAHAALMGATIVYSSATNGSYMHGAAKMVQWVNSLLGYSDREVLAIDNAMSNKFVLTGMYANGRNIYFLTPQNVDTAVVDETAEGVVISMDGQTVTFAGGTLVNRLRDNGADVGTKGYWIETPAGVNPDIFNGAYNEGMKEPSFKSWDFVVPEHPTLSLPYYYGPAWWSVTNITKEEAFIDGALKLSGSSDAVHRYFTDSHFFGTLIDDFGIGVDVTLPATDLPADSQIQILRPCNGSIPVQAHNNGIVLSNGQLYYHKVDDMNLMTMNEALVAGETYKFKTIYEGAQTEAPVCDYYVTKMDGTVVAYAEDINVGSCQLGKYWSTLSFVVENIGDEPVVIDNYRLFTVNPDISMDLSIFDATTGTEITDLTTPTTTALGYRVDWSNLTTDARTIYIMAQYYDDAGNPTGDPVQVSEFVMTAGGVSVASGSFDPEGQAARLYIMKGDTFVGGFNFTEIGYGYMPIPNVTTWSGLEPTYKYSTTIDGTYGDWDLTNPLGTYYLKAYIAGNDEFVPYEGEPVEFQVVKAQNTWVTDLRCPGVPYGQPVIPYAEPYFGADQVVYLFSSEKNGEYSPVAPTARGMNYWVKAYVPGGDLWLEAESEPVWFAILEGVQNMTILNAPDPFVAFGQEFTLEVQGAGGEGALTWEVTEGQDVATIDADGKVTIIGAGDVTITATKAGDENYAAGSATVSFIALKAISEDVEIPTGLTATYGDKLSAVALPEGWAWVDADTVIGVIGNASYFAVYTEDENHEPVTARLTIAVAKAENAWNTNVSIQGWEVGAEANAPAGAAKFGDIVFTYSNAENGTYTATVPTEIGTYWLKAVVYGTSNYSGLEAKVQFTISAVTETTDPTNPNPTDPSTDPTEPSTNPTNPTESGEDKKGGSTLVIVLVVVGVAAVAAVAVIFLKKKKPF